MDDFFTVVSLVIAISGSTYAALGSLRERYRDEVEENRRNIQEWHKDLITLGNQVQQDAADRIFRSLQWAWFCWKWTSTIPTWFFVIVAYFLAIIAVFAFWFPGTEPKPDFVWMSSIMYGWVIPVLIVVNISCIVGMKKAVSQIGKDAEALKEHVESRRVDDVASDLTE